MINFKKKWVNGFAPMYEQPNPQSRKVRDLPEKSLVIAGDEVVLWGDVPFVEVAHTDTKTWHGWIYAGMLETYASSLPENCVLFENQTTDPTDAEQYIHYNGGRQVNLCGQISVAYCMGASLTELLGMWREKSPSVWQRIFGKAGKVAGGTGVPDLISMFAAFDVKAESLAEAIKDKYLNRIRYTVEGLQELNWNGYVILGVKIKNGRLAPSGDLHWVVVRGVYAERTGYGTIEIFNPYFNRVESYSWQEFTASAGNPCGVFARYTQEETP